VRSVCVLLPGPIARDGRVIRTIRTLEDSEAEVDLFHAGRPGEEDGLFGEHVRAFCVPRSDPISRVTKLRRNALFHREYLDLAKRALGTGVRYELVWANDLPALLPGVKLKAKLGARLVYDSHEIFTETLNQYLPVGAPGARGVGFRGLLSFMRTTGRRVEQKLVKRVDRFLTVNRSLAEHFAERYGIPTPGVLMNCPPRGWGDVEPAVNFRQEYGWAPDDRVLLYQGMLNEGRGLEPLLHAVARVPAPARLVILGAGPLRPHLLDLVDTLRLRQKVRFHDAVPYDRLAGYTVAADYGVALLEGINLSKRLAAPNKLFEYLHAGLPVLCSDRPEMRRVLERYPAGVLAGEDPIAIAGAMRRLFEAERPDEFRRQAAAAAAEYCWENQAEIIRETIAALPPRSGG